MNIISRILNFNSAFVEQKEYQEFNTTKYPDKKLQKGKLKNVTI